MAAGHGLGVLAVGHGFVGSVEPCHNALMGRKTREAVQMGDCKIRRIVDGNRKQLAVWLAKNRSHDRGRKEPMTTPFCIIIIRGKAPQICVFSPGPSPAVGRRVSPNALSFIIDRPR